jgi:hypothetical protein
MTALPTRRFTMPAERTFLAIKPDGVQRGLVGEILGRFERKGFMVVGLKQLTPSRELAESHYGVPRERPGGGAGVGRRWRDRRHRSGEPPAAARG